MQITIICIKVLLIDSCNLVVDSISKHKIIDFDYEKVSELKNFVFREMEVRKKVSIGIGVDHAVVKVKTTCGKEYYFIY